MDTTTSYPFNSTFLVDDLDAIDINEEELIYACFIKNPEPKSWIDPYDSIWLKIMTVGVYFVEIVSSVIMLAFVAYETNGYAGHYRTLINQLLSHLYTAVSDLTIFPTTYKS